MSNKIHYYLEIFWLLMAIVCFAFAFYLTSKNGFSNNKVLYICGGIATFMYIFRRYLRKSKERK